MNPEPALIFSYGEFWAKCRGPAQWLPILRNEMEQLGWDSCNIIIVLGTAALITLV